MTIATSVVVALSLAVYAAVDLRASRAERASAVRRNIEDVAMALRYQVESTGTRAVLAKADKRSEAMSAAIAPLMVVLLSADTAEQSSTARAVTIGRIVIAASLQAAPNRWVEEIAGFAVGAISETGLARRIPAMPLFVHLRTTTVPFY